MRRQRKKNDDDRQKKKKHRQQLTVYEYCAIVDDSSSVIICGLYSLIIIVDLQLRSIYDNNLFCKIFDIFPSSHWKNQFLRKQKKLLQTEICTKKSFRNNMIY